VSRWLTDSAQGQAPAAAPGRAQVLPRAALWAARARSLLRPPRYFFDGESDPPAQGRGDDWHAAGERFHAWCSRHRGCAADVGLSGRWIYGCVPPPAAGALDDAALRDYAHAQFQHFLGTQPLRYATCTRAGATLAIATPQPLVQALCAVASRSGVRVRRLQPWWLPGLARCMKTAGQGTSAILAVEPGFVTALQIEGGVVRRMIGAAIDAGPFEPEAFVATHRLAGLAHVIGAPKEPA
jgi:hypothetical protein